MDTARETQGEWIDRWERDVDEEKLKRYFLFALVGFNLTVMILMLIVWFARGGYYTLGAFFFDFTIILLVAGGVGAGVFYTCKQLDV